MYPLESLSGSNSTSRNSSRRNKYEHVLIYKAKHWKQPKYLTISAKGQQLMKRHAGIQNRYILFNIFAIHIQY